jgi:hypothetical protein
MYRTYVISVFSCSSFHASEFLHVYTLDAAKFDADDNNSTQCCPITHIARERERGYNHGGPVPSTARSIFEDGITLQASPGKTELNHRGESPFEDLDNSAGLVVSI